MDCIFRPKTVSICYFLSSRHTIHVSLCRCESPSPPLSLSKTISFNRFYMHHFGSVIIVQLKLIGGIITSVAVIVINEANKQTIDDSLFCFFFRLFRFVCTAWLPHFARISNVLEMIVYFRFFFVGLAFGNEDLKLKAWALDHFSLYAFQWK